jgi:hypothetical protein
VGLIAEPEGGCELARVCAHSFFGLTGPCSATPLTASLPASIHSGPGPALSGDGFQQLQPVVPRRADAPINRPHTHNTRAAHLTPPRHVGQSILPAVMQFEPSAFVAVVDTPAGTADPSASIRSRAGIRKQALRKLTRSIKLQLRTSSAAAVHRRRRHNHQSDGRTTSSGIPATSHASRYATAPSVPFFSTAAVS